MKRIVQEALLVAVAGIALSFAANALSPHGLKLTTNYFPAKKSTQPSAGATNVNPASSNAVADLTPSERLAAALKENGLQLADSNLVLRLLHDPRYEQQLVVFIDARSEEHYKEGHIPGAFQFDHFHFEKYIPTLMPVCQGAEQIVVYCDGGDCELSQHAAMFLRDSFAVPAQKLYVYGGGINEWNANHLPVEIGERKSGQIKAPAP
ncbi:MAG: hypothetical protein C5B50_16845 [Verrucomicrobia bacterium]|nr:MAG: hypothetical protein C5B50_16845 [Verrucomicrobiota bacterium]